MGYILGTYFSPCPDQTGVSKSQGHLGYLGHNFKNIKVSQFEYCYMKVIEMMFIFNKICLSSGEYQN
jgi:hypothetical protein